MRIEDSQSRLTRHKPFAIWSGSEVKDENVRLKNLDRQIFYLIVAVAMKLVEDME